MAARNHAIAGVQNIPQPIQCCPTFICREQALTSDSIQGSPKPSRTISLAEASLRVSRHAHEIHFNISRAAGGHVAHSVSIQMLSMRCGELPVHNGSLLIGRLDNHYFNEFIPWLSSGIFCSVDACLARFTVNRSKPVQTSSPSGITTPQSSSI